MIFGENIEATLILPKKHEKQGLSIAEKWFQEADYFNTIDTNSPSDLEKSVFIQIY